MNFKYIFYGFLLFTLGQLITWVQINGPIMWPWAKTYKWALIIIGMPITWIFMEATATTVKGFGGVFWPGRFISFASGILIFTIMTYIFRAEPVSMKTILSLTLALALVFVQLFWK